MELREYCNQTEVTAKYPDSHSLEYLGLGLASEAGEVAGVIKKVIRDFGPPGQGGIPDEFRDKLEAELGDVMWYFSELCRRLGLDPGEVLKKNSEKLLSRLERGKISGSGDNR